MDLSDREKEGFVICPKCHGDDYTRGRCIYLLDICMKCGGQGYVDFVAAAMTNRYRTPDRSKQLDYAMKNIEILRMEIVQQGALVGANVRTNIDIETRDQFTYSMRPELSLYRGGY